MQTLEQPKLAETTAENVITIVTHDGVFHADDVFAVATILMVVGPRFDPFTGKERVRIVRTRSHKLIEAADIVVDVGGVFDVATNRFDHHQGAGERDSGVPYAAFGLVWDEYGYTVCRSALLGTDSGHLGGEAQHAVASSLVEALDAHDTGHTKAGAAGIPAAISAFNPRWDEDQTEEHFARKFDDAVSFAQGVLARSIHSAASAISAKVEVDAAIESTLEVRDALLVLERYAPWQERVTTHHEGSHLKFVVYPAVDGSWRAQTIQVYNDKFRPVRCSFPKVWWGMRGDQLDAATALPGCTFCHINGFVLGHATREGAVALANLALRPIATPPE
jgi:uncharacterized UPF0160 family protein